MRVGIDIGAVTIGVALIKGRRLISSGYRFHNGDIRSCLHALITALGLEGKQARVGLTGRAAGPLKLPCLDDVIATIEGASWMAGTEPPDIHNILMIGGESFLLIQLNGDGTYRSHEINTDCASGTGVFLEQQARRLKVDIRQFADMAAAYEDVAPVIATRCAVFAKSDLIHRQQEGCSLASITAGLCDGVARSIVDTIIKGKKLPGKLCLVGGVALNRRVVAALTDLLETEIVVLDRPEIIPAVGAALLACESLDVGRIGTDEWLGLDEGTPLNPPLRLERSPYPDFAADVSCQDGEVEITFYEDLTAGQVYDVVMGIDIGSTSTKLVVSTGAEVLLGLYTYTRGEPVQACQQLFACLAQLEEGGGFRFDWLAVGTTGSGRQMVGQLIRADLVINEISAHARAAVHLDPAVDTIIEIGGQDSKFVRLQQGAVVQAVMNYICAAGTGSFIEEQAQKLDVPLKEYAHLAMGKRGPVISDRCTVYMERDLSRLLAEGWQKEELLASVLHSVRDNYLMRVKGQAKLGDHIYFQGATARNKALVAAFETALQRPIRVSRFCHLTGAYGVSLLLKERHKKATRFVGLKFAALPFKQTVEICELCRNRCKITLIEVGDSRVTWGLSCGREYEDKKYREKQLPFESVMHIRQRCLKQPKIKRTTAAAGIKKPRVGLPNTLPMVEYLPLWQGVFRRLGLEVVVAPQEREMLRRGKNIAQSEFCVPILMAHGQVDWLKQQGVDYIFLPIMLHGQKQGIEHERHFFCYYTSYISTLIRNSPVLAVEDKLISPLIDLRLMRQQICDSLYRSLPGELHRRIPRNLLQTVFKKSLDSYLRCRQKLKRAGRKLLAALGRENSFAIVLLGRPYNILDRSMNQDIPELIRQYGYRVLTMDMLPLERRNPRYAGEYLSKVHWYYGQRILKATALLARNRRLFPVYITNFRCSPDAFILSYFKDIMERYGKPYLIIQLDELGSAVGYQTRIEAALESFRNWQKRKPRRGHTFSFIPLKSNKTWILPHLDEVNVTLAQAVFRRFGYDAVVAEETPQSIVQGLKRVGGGECVPTAALIGSVIQTVEKYGLHPSKTAVYLPASFIPCNFPQIPIIMQLGLKRAGLGDLKIFTTAPAGQKESLPLNLAFMRAFMVASLIHQMVAKIRPYEVNRGESEAVCRQEVEQLSRVIMAGGDVAAAFRQTVHRFGELEIFQSDGRRPLLILLGDLYVVWNRIFNFGVERAIEEAGGEVLPSNFIDIFHYGNLNHIELCLKRRAFWPLIETKAVDAIVRLFDVKFRKIASPVLGGIHPLFDRPLLKRLRGLGIPPELGGETPINLAKILYYLHHFPVDAVVHINPLYCCPGDVTSALSSWVEKNFSVPVINLFYDGIHNPNENLKPYIHYLREKYRAGD